MGSSAADARFRRGWLTIAVLAAVIVLAGWLLLEGRLAGLGSTVPPPTGGSTSGDALGVPPRPAEAFEMAVEYVFDGDTIEARVETPNDIVTTARPIRIRLIGIDTPEGRPSPECWADEARAHLRELLPVGSTVWVGPDRDTWDDNQRRLFYLWTPDGRFVNLELVAAGDAEAIRVWPNVEHYDLLREAQADAEAADVGQWGACD
jgi:endonuclease YncB( thermonuclease family)